MVHLIFEILYAIISKLNGSPSFLEINHEKQTISDRCNLYVDPGHAGLQRAQWAGRSARSGRDNYRPGTGTSGPEPNTCSGRYTRPRRYATTDESTSAGRHAKAFHSIQA